MSTTINETRVQYFQNSFILLVSGAVVNATNVLASGYYNNLTNLFPLCDLVVRASGGSTYNDMSITKICLPPSEVRFDFIYTLNGSNNNFQAYMEPSMNNHYFTRDYGHGISAPHLERKKIGYKELSSNTFTPTTFLVYLIPYTLTL